MTAEFALFDAVALSADERAKVHSFSEAVWGYDHLPDPTAIHAGPIWTRATDQAVRFAEALQRDPDRWWAASFGESSANFEGLTRHLRRLRYVRSRDGERYFFRFADARSLMAVATALPPDRQRLLTGPIRKWTFSDRGAGQAVLQSESSSSSIFEIVLGDKEMSALVDTIWPDQLLSEALERVETTATPAECYAWARELCRLLRLNSIEAHPLQAEAMSCVLASRGRAIDDPAFLTALVEGKVNQSVEPIIRFANVKVKR